jgi:hypothetical protein
MRRRNMALIDRDRKLGDIQSEEKKGICSCKTGDSTCCPKASKGLYLYYSEVLAQPPVCLIAIGPLPHHICLQYQSAVSNNCTTASAVQEAHIQE